MARKPANCGSSLGRVASSTTKHWLSTPSAMRKRKNIWATPSCAPCCQAGRRNTRSCPTHQRKHCSNRRQQRKWPFREGRISRRGAVPYIPDKAGKMGHWKKEWKAHYGTAKSEEHSTPWQAVDGDS